MAGFLKKYGAGCLGSSCRDAASSYPGDGSLQKTFSRNGNGDGLQSERTFSRNGKHTYGVFSMAVMQRNPVLEQQSQIESGDFGTFIGVYDGHGGPQAANFVCESLYRRFLGNLGTTGVVDKELLEKVFLDTDQAYKSAADVMWEAIPQWASSGTCCLVGVIQGNKLHISILGDSRAVLGSKYGDIVMALQLSKDHNVNLPAVSSDLLDEYTNEPEDCPIIFRYKLKGLLQVSRSIGDVYMKYDGFNREPLDEEYRLPEPTHVPYMSAVPSTKLYDLNLPRNSTHCRLLDYFLIFASRGLWDLMSTERAVDIVFNSTSEESARNLVQEALKAAKERKDCQLTRDDITVYVIYLDWDLIVKPSDVRGKKKGKARKHLEDPISLRSAPPELPMKFLSFR